MLKIFFNITGYVGHDDVKYVAERRKVGRKVLGNEGRGMAPLGHILGKDLSAAGHGFVADEQRAVGQQGTEQRALTTRSSTEVENHRSR